VSAGVSIVPGSIVVQNDRTIAVQFAVDATASLGSALFRVQSSDGGFDLQLIVIVPPAPRITRITPASGPPGSTVNIELLGTDFHRVSAALEVLGGGVSVSQYSVPRELDGQHTSNSMTATLVIDPNATPGARTVRVSTIGGVGDGTFSVSFQRPLMGTFTASPNPISPGRSSRLSWSAIANATACEVNNGVGRVACTASSVDVFPAATTEYQLKATGPGGQDWRYVTVNVEAPRPPPSNVSAARAVVPFIPRSK
jgi:hypothetical protein